MDEPAIIVTGDGFRGTIKPNEPVGTVEATFQDRDRPLKYSDYLASWRIYRGPCEDLF